MNTIIDRTSFTITLLSLLIFSGLWVTTATATTFDRIASLANATYFSGDSNYMQPANIIQADTHPFTIAIQNQLRYLLSERRVTNAGHRVLLLPTRGIQRIIATHAYVHTVDKFYALQYLEWNSLAFQLNKLADKKNNTPAYTNTQTPSPGREGWGLINVKNHIPEIIVETRYNTTWNFTGTVVPGYRGNVCLLSKQAAKQLAFVQQEVSTLGYSLLIFDCYRPIQAVNYFVTWAKNYRQTKMKKIFYPNVSKTKLIPEYISDRSSHSRGSTLDLTLVNTSKKSNKKFKILHFREPMTDCRSIDNIEKTGQLDMGTSFDCFSPLSHTFSQKISKAALKNRLILKTAMEKFGFKNYSKEWWHYTLKNEPYKNQYFDFDVD